MLHRKVEHDINNWIQTSSKALLVYGVRQAGKTYIVRECLRASGCDYAEFNLINQPEVADIISNASSAEDLILKLSLFSNKRLIPGETFIFFDEIQRSKEIVTKIKFLVEDGRFRYVLSGSLLGVEIVNLKSAPVGYLQTITMHPLDFEEFLQIFNIDAAVLSLLRDSYEQKIPVEEVIHKRMMDLFNLYLIIGGMPAAVEAYRKTENIDVVIDEHKSIIEQYKLDFTQYEADNRKLILTNIYEMIPAQINEKNKRFVIADINKNLRVDRVSDSFTWLWKAGVALGTFNVTEPTIPLLLSEKSTLFKVFLSDVGLLTTIYGKACKFDLINNRAGINKGAIHENVIAQELHAHGYPLYYYNSKSKGELDFVIEHDGCVLPIEVKSGKDYARHCALNNVMSVEQYGIPKAYVFAHTNVNVAGKVIYLPLYMIMFVRENQLTFSDISIDRFKLS